MDVLPHVSHRIDEYLTPLIYHDDFTAACKAGVSNRTLELLLQRTIPVWRDAVDAAVQGGHLHVLRWMTERQDHLGPWRDDFDSVIDIAARRGHLDIVKWLYERGVDCEKLRDIDKETAEYLEKTWLYHHCLAHASMLAVKHGDDRATRSSWSMERRL
ncbi:hypothetical protein PHMEG_00035822 [Phytophthora megakarya]|uniref:Uncharacterized protein n=1 Tax=Phytophthora megakarya TaxID=4795 RepID=A0A225UPG0_9STRA|nr:hypothetical protein PHMEG_00035822 [Phytophthora megakarya]